MRIPWVGKLQSSQVYDAKTLYALICIDKMETFPSSSRTNYFITLMLSEYSFNYKLGTTSAIPL